MARRWKWIAGSSLLLVALLALGAYWLVRPVPLGEAPDVASLLRDAVERAAVEGENAAPRYIEAIELYDAFERGGLAAPTESWWRQGWTDFEWSVSDAISSLEFGEWDDPRHAPAKRVLADLEPVIDAVLRAAEAPAFRVEGLDRVLEATAPEDLSQAMRAVEPDVWSIRELMPVLDVALRGAINAGDAERAAQLLNAGFRLTDHLRQAPLNWLELLAIPANEAMMLDRVREAAVRGELRDAAMIDALERVVAARPPLRLDRDAGEAAATALLLRDLWALRVDHYGLPWTDRIRLTWGRFVGDQVMFGEFTRETSIWSETVRWPRVERAAEEIGSAVGGWWSGDLSSDPFGAVREFESVLPPMQIDSVSMMYAMPSMPLLESRRAATLLLLELARIRLETGAWPAALEGAVDPELRIDPLSGEAWIYGVTTEGAITLEAPAPEAVREALPERFKDSAPNMIPLMRDGSGFVPWLGVEVE